MTLTFADLFSGCGGFSVGFHQDPSFAPSLAADSWEAAGQNYQANLSGAEFLAADLSNENEKRVIAARLRGECDVLLGGPPCQGFSTLGKRRDDDARSTLVDHFADLARRIAPKIILLENVRGITSKAHPRGGTFADALMAQLKQGRSGYTVSADFINTQTFGMAQTRVRWLMVAIRKNLRASKYGHELFWRTLNDRRPQALSVLRDAIGDLSELPTDKDVFTISDARGERTIYNHRAMNHSAELKRRLAHVPPGGGLLDVPRDLLTPHLRKMIDGHYGSGGHVKNIYGRLEWGKPSGTIVAGMDKITCGRFVHPDQDRLLTPRECARLQSFPDWFRFVGGLVTQYYLIGNAVPPALSMAAARGVLEVLNESEEDQPTSGRRASAN